eukprot:Skav207739  [mRNA]  locus=scaffold362:391276:393297:- [translate_table: standard]
MAGVDGNWACMTCGNVNFAHREVCNRCQAPYQAPDQAPYQAPYEETTPRRGRPVAGVDGNWACGTCGNVNFAKRDVCNRCSAPKPMEMGAGYAEAAMKPQRPRPIAGVDGNWSCPACTNVNFPHRTSCNRCGLAKPDERQRGSPPVAGVNGNWACDGLSLPRVPPGQKLWRSREWPTRGWSGRQLVEHGLQERSWAAQSVRLDTTLGLQW